MSERWTGVGRDPALSYRPIDVPVKAFFPVLEHCVAAVVRSNQCEPLVRRPNAIGALARSLFFGHRPGARFMVLTASSDESYGESHQPPAMAGVIASAPSCRLDALRSYIERVQFDRRSNLTD
jgi:hypothetical protein